MSDIDKEIQDILMGNDPNPADGGSGDAHEQEVQNILMEEQPSPYAGVPERSANQFESYPNPSPQEALNFGKSLADDFGYGLAQHAAGWGSGLGKMVGDFKTSDQPFLDRIIGLPQSLSEGFAQGKQEYNQEIESVQENMTPAQRALSAVVGGVASAPLGGAIAAGEKLTAKALSNFGFQGILGFIGSKEEDIKDKAYDALLSGSIGAAFSGSGEIAGKAYEFGRDIVGAAKHGAARVASSIQGASPHAILDFIEGKSSKDVKKWADSFLPTGGADVVKTEQKDLIARNIIDGFRKKIVTHRKDLGKRMTAAIEQKFGDAPLSDEHHKFIMNKLDKISKGLDPSIPADKELLSEISNVTKMLSPNETPGRFDLMLGRVPPSSSNASYSKMYKAYRYMHELTTPQYYVNTTNGLMAKNRSTAVSRSFSDILEGSDGIKDGLIGKIAPDIRAIDKEYELFYDAGKKINKKLYSEKGSSTRYLENVGARKAESLDTQALQKAIPDSGIQKEAEMFERYSTVDDAGLQARNFAQRATTAAVLGGGASAAGYLMGGDVLPSGSPLFLATLGTVPLFGKQLFKGMRGARAIMGPTVEAAKAGGDLLTSPNMQRIYIEELKKRTGQDSPESPLQ